MSRRAIRYVRHAASLLCAAAVGALLFSVHVATSVFAQMPDDRVMAGRIAGRAFVGAYAVAAVASLVALVVTFATAGGKDRAMASILVVCAALQLLWIAPAIVSHGAGWPGTFASLHAAGGVLHLVLAVVSLILAWRLLADVAD